MRRPILNLRHISRGLLIALFLVVSFDVSARTQIAIDFTLRDINGIPYQLSDYFGERIVLINFWATWCQPCVRELQHLQQFHDEYSDEGLQILAISVDGPGTRSQITSFLNRHGYTFPVLLDTESKVLALYDPQVILPYSLLINRDGTISYVQKGYSPGDENVLQEKILEATSVEEVLDEVGEGRARGISYHVNEALLFRNFTDSRYVDVERGGRNSQVLNQTDLTVTSSDFMVGFRFDSNLDYSPLQDRYLLSKKFLEVDKGPVNLRIGDFFYSVGKGLTLNLTKLFEEEGLEHTIDTTIRGGKLSLSLGSNTGEIFGGIVGGGDTGNADDLWGGAFNLMFRDLINFRFSHLVTHLVEDPAYGNADFSLQAVGIEAPDISGVARVSGEFSLLQHRPEFQGVEKRGHGLYLESSFYLQDLSLLLELKDYDNFYFKYSRPPSLESEELDIMASQFDTEVIDITGVSGRVDYRLPGSSTLLFGKLSYFQDSTDGHPDWGKYSKDIKHFSLGFEKYFDQTGYMNVLAGYRREDNTSALSVFTDNETLHWQFNSSYSLTPSLSIEADWKAKRYASEYRDFRENRFFLALHKASRGIITIFYEETGDPEVLFFAGRKSHWAGQVEVKLSSSNSISALWGSTMGNVKCSGGVCRYFPPFEGLRVEAILRL